MSRVIPLKEEMDTKKKGAYENASAHFASQFVIYKDYEVCLGEEDINGDQEKYIRASTDEFVIFDPSHYSGHLYLEIAKIELDTETKIYKDNVQGKETEKQLEVPKINSKKSKNSLIKFCKKFGLLGVRDRKYTHIQVRENDFLEGPKSIYLHDVKEDFIDSDLVEVIYRMKIAVGHIERLTDGTITEKERNELDSIVNSELTFVYRRIQRKGEEYHPQLLFASLIDFAWWQLQEAMLGNINYRRCKNDKCGNIFAVIHGNQNFCPPAPRTKTSACLNAYKQRKRRQKQKNSLEFL